MKNSAGKKLRKHTHFVIVLLVLFNSCQKQHLVEKSAPWEIIRYKEYMIENNTWNIQAAKGNWTETIFCDTLTGMMGWKWDFSGEKDMKNTNEAKTFPEIIFGKKPYGKYQSTTSCLPVKLTSAQFRLRYEYAANARGIYNTTTDIAFTDSINPVEKNIRAKMMIWFDHQNLPFYKPETLTQAKIGGLQYKIFVDTLHSGPEGKWNFIALLADGFPSKGELNLKEYCDYFLSTGVLKPEWYLSSIEIGSEISSGKGEITFKRYEIY